MGKQREELERGDDMLNQTRDLVTRELQNMVDIRTIEEKIG
jgi:hypothetical protein